MRPLPELINEVIRKDFPKQIYEVHILLESFRQQNPADADYYFYSALRNAGGDVNTLRYHLAHIDELVNTFLNPSSPPIASSPLGEPLKKFIRQTFPNDSANAEKICLTISKDGFLTNSLQAEPLRKTLVGCVQRANGNLNALQTLIQRAKNDNAVWEERFMPYIGQYVTITTKQGQTLASSAVESVDAILVRLYYGGRMSDFRDVKYALIEDFHSP